MESVLKLRLWMAKKLQREMQLSSCRKISLSNPDRMPWEMPGGPSVRDYDKVINAFVREGVIHIEHVPWSLFDDYVVEVLPIFEEFFEKLKAEHQQCSAVNAVKTASNSVLPKIPKYRLIWNQGRYLIHQVENETLTVVYGYSDGIGCALLEFIFNGNPPGKLISYKTLVDFGQKQRPIDRFAPTEKGVKKVLAVERWENSEAILAVFSNFASTE